MIAKEMAYQQLIADTATDINGLQARALLAEAVKLRAEYNQVYLSSEAQRSTAAPAATLGAGAGTGASTSTPLPSRSVPAAPTASVDTVEQRKDRRQKQLADHWKQVQNFLATCRTTNLVERQKAYDNYLAAFTQFEVDFPPETPPANTARCRREADAADAGVQFNEPTRQTVDPVMRSQIFQNSSLPVQNDLPLC